MDSSQHIVLYVMLVVGVFTLKQFVADFVLQTNWMAQGKARLQNWQLPLLAHAGTHGVLCVLVTVISVPNLWWFGAIDFAIHMVIDFGKSKIGHRTGWGVADAPYWMLFGFDQLLHHITGLVLAYFVVVA